MSDVEDLADAGLLPTIRLKAANALQAEANAYITSGKHVLRVERVEAVIAAEPAGALEAAEA